MDAIARAASEGSLSAFALALSAVLVSALAAVVVWLVRDRIEARKRYDATLEKRLQAGSGKMEALERDMRELQIRTVEMSSRLVSHDHCARAMSSLGESLERTVQTAAETQAAIARLDGRTEEGLRQVSRLLSGLVRIPRTGDEGDER
jgi:Tfp pilus assembly protein PilN